MSAVVDLVRNAQAMLIDFDGPICRIFGRLDLREEIKRASKALRILPEDFTSDPARPDPLELLRFVDQTAPALLTRAESLVTEIEVRGAQLAELESGAESLLLALRRAQVPWAIVSNNSGLALRRFAERYSMVFEGAPLIGRVAGNIAFLKPHPHLIQQGLTALEIGPDRALMVGDSPTDLIAARIAGVRGIALVTKESKRASLAEIGPEAMVTSLEELLGG